MKRPSNPGRHAWEQEKETYLGELERYASYLEGKIDVLNERVKAPRPTEEDIKRAKTTAAGFAGFEDVLNSVLGIKK